MNPGRLDRPISLLRPVQTNTVDLSPVLTFEVAGTAWASMRPIGIRELVAAAGQEIPTLDTVWTIPYRTDLAIGADWRIRDETGQDHALSGPPIEIQRRAYLELRTNIVPASAAPATT